MLFALERVLLRGMLTVMINVGGEVIGRKQVFSRSNCLAEDLGTFDKVKQ